MILYAVALGALSGPTSGQGKDSEDRPVLWQTSTS